MSTSHLNTPALIEVRHCSVRFDACVALAAIDFLLHAGERWVVTGANGAGKSVFLKLLRGDVWPTPDARVKVRYYLQGKIHHEPAGIKHLLGLIAPERQDKYVRYGWNLSVTQVITTGLFDEDIPLTKPSAAQQRRVTQALRRFKLWALRSRKLLELSYGQRRRVLIARLWVSPASIWLLDEVFNGLDQTMRQLLLRLLSDTHAAPTWVMAVHSAEDIPASATHLLHLQHGKVRYAGPIDKTHIERVRRDVQARHAAARCEVARKALPLKTRNASSLVQPLLQLRNVSLYRDYRAVLKDVNWSVQPHEHWAVMGANGSGKSSLLLLLYGDFHPAHGGEVIRAGMPRGTPISEWKRRVGYVSPELQAEHVWTQTLEELVASGRYASIGLNQPMTRADRRAAAPWLEFFGLSDLRDRTVRQVSYGQLRLALLARALVAHPKLLLLDEPFTGLDPQMHAQMSAALQAVAQRGVQLIMAIHDDSDLLPVVSKILRIEANGRVSEHCVRST